jgi:hypothetical protein
VKLTHCKIKKRNDTGSFYSAIEDVAQSITQRQDQSNGRDYHTKLCIDDDYQNLGFSVAIIPISTVFWKGLGWNRDKTSPPPDILEPYVKTANEYSCREPMWLGTKQVAKTYARGTLLKYSTPRRKEPFAPQRQVA